MNNRRFFNFLSIIVAVYFTYFESIEALVQQFVCMKGPKTSAFQSLSHYRFRLSLDMAKCQWYSFFEIGVSANGRVGAIPTYTNSVI